MLLSARAQAVLMIVAGFLIAGDGHIPQTARIAGVIVVAVVAWAIYRSPA